MPPSDFISVEAMMKYHESHSVHDAADDYGAHCTGNISGDGKESEERQTVNCLCWFGLFVPSVKPSL